MGNIIAEVLGHSDTASLSDRDLIVGLEVLRTKWNELIAEACRRVKEDCEELSIFR